MIIMHNLDFCFVAAAVVGDMIAVLLYKPANRYE